VNFRNPFIAITIMINKNPIPNPEKGFFKMTQDFEALGRYTDAENRMRKAVEERDKIINQLNLSTQSFGKNSIMGGYIKPYNVLRAKNFLEDISKLEEEINSDVSEMNANASKCGKSTVRISDG
jgi:hypothetical protein